MKLNKSTKVVVLIPVYNENRNVVEKIVNDILNETEYYIILGNDGSNTHDLIDYFSSIVKDTSRVKVISNKRNKGQGNIIRKMNSIGYDLGYSIFVTFDGDGQHRLIDLIKGVEMFLNGKFDCIIGSRFYKSYKKPFNMPSLKYIMLMCLLAFLKYTRGMKLTDPQNGLRIYGRKFSKTVMSRISKFGYGHTNEILSYIFEKNSQINFGEFYTKVLYEKKEKFAKTLRQIFEIIFL